MIVGMVIAIHLDMITIGDTVKHVLVLNDIVGKGQKSTGVP